MAQSGEANGFAYDGPWHAECPGTSHDDFTEPTNPFDETAVMGSEDLDGEACCLSI